MLSLEDAAEPVAGGSHWLRLAQGGMSWWPALAQRLGLWGLRANQRATENVHGKVRKAMLNVDEQKMALLSFSGHGE